MTTKCSRSKLINQLKHIHQKTMVLGHWVAQQLELVISIQVASTMWIIFIHIVMTSSSYAKCMTDTILALFNDELPKKGGWLVCDIIHKQLKFMPKILAKFAPTQTGIMDCPSHFHNTKYTIIHPDITLMCLQTIWTLHPSLKAISATKTSISKWNGHLQKQMQRTMSPMTVQCLHQNKFLSAKQTF